MKNLNRIQLGGLRAIEAVGRLGSLRAAAAELGVTPGAISQQVLKTEQQLGHSLFQRLPKGMTPTPLGQQMVSHLTRGLSELSAAVSLTDRHRDDILTVSVAPVFASKWLVWRLTDFKKLHPDIQVRVDATVAVIDPALSDIDVCIRVGKGQWPDVKASKLLEHRIFPVCSPALAAKLHSPESLTAVPIIRDPGEMFSWNTWLKPNGLDESILKDGPRFSDGSLCLDAAIAGQGVFLAWETLACDALDTGRLVAPFNDRYSTGLAYWFVVGQYAPKRRAVQEFEQWLRLELGKI